MQFYEKLDFLMNVTKTTNSSLSMHISIDASHISRLRRGERRLVPDAEYLAAMSTYFIKQCVEDYLKMAVADVVEIPVTLFDYPDQAAEKIYQWLLSEHSPDIDAIDSILKDITDIKNDKQFSNYLDTINLSKLVQENNVSLFYGIQGKREAVLRFLSIVLENKDSGDLLLFSDEPMDWLTEDIEFQKKMDLSSV